MGKPRLTSADTSLLKVPQYRCDVEGCRKYFCKLSRLKYHQNTHLEEKPYKCTHQGCTSSYYRPNHLKRHVEAIHKSPADSTKSFSCVHDVCKAAFDSEDSLFFHTKRKHCSLPFQCSFCDKKFSKKWKIKEHEAGHTGAFPFKCDFDACTEEFKDYMLFRAHKRQHEKKAKKTTLTCPDDGCQQIFEKWSELVNHKKTSHSLGTQCKTCNKTFAQRNLKVHLPIHQEERPTFQCTYDGSQRFYFHQKNLNHHIKVKHEENGFNCTLCDRKLSTKQKLLHHIDIINDRPPRPKKRKKSSQLKKIATMTEEDWNLKKTGPARFVRHKYDFIKFPDSSKVQTVSNTTELVKGTPCNEFSASEINESEIVTNNMYYRILKSTTERI